MSQPASRYVTLLDRELHYTEWGAGHGETVVMWHGLARTGRDFDLIAARLAARYRVICPDTPGRGLSQWSPTPERDYALGAYAALAEALLDRLGAGRVRWVGTSMGGAIGIKLAGGALRDRVSHLVLNDIGPKLAEPAVKRIRDYVGHPPRFATVTELETFFRTVYAPFGIATDAEWRSLAETSVRRTEDGMVTPHYDPRIVLQFTEHPEDYDLWPDYDAIRARTLLLRGVDSDLLTPETADAMTERGPRARLAVILGCGHAPALNTPEQHYLIESFLAEPA